MRLTNALLAACCRGHPETAAAVGKRLADFVKGQRSSLSDAGARHLKQAVRHVEQWAEVRARAQRL